MRLLNNNSTILKILEKILKTDVSYLAKGSFWLNFNFIISSALAFVLYIIMGNFLPKEVYGTYQYILSLSTIFTAFSITGMGSAITQSVARGNEGDFIKSILPQIKWSILSSSLAIITGLYYLIQGNNTLFVTLIIVAILLPITNSTNTYIAYFTGKKDFKKTFLYNTIFNTIYTTIMVVTILVTKNPINIVLSYFVTTSIINTILYLRTIKISKPNQITDSDTLSYAKHLSLMNILGTLVSKIDSIVVFHYLGATNLAIYTFAKIIPEKFSGLFKSFGTIAFPKFSEKNIDDIRENITKKTLVFLFSALLFSLFYILIAPVLFKVFFPQYLNSVLYSQVISLTLIASAASLPTYALMAQKLKKRLYFLNTVSPVLQLGIIVIMAHFWGIWGIILSKIIGSVIHLSISIFSIKHKTI